jgi:GNAT superfamily N-acetyltransferase
VPPVIEVRDAQPGDAEVLTEIWQELTSRIGHQARLLAAPRLAVVRAAITRTQVDQSARLVVAEVDGQVRALAYLRRAAISPLHVEETVTVEYLHVLEAARRHGVGKALIAEAAAWAEAYDSTHLAVVGSPTAREANRFLARLGLGQAGVLRFGSTNTIRRRLAADHSPNLIALLTSRRSALARRAVLARTAGAAPVPLAAVPDVTLPAAQESTGT